ncbi:MAG: M20 family metallopeptidase [Rubrobacteraceae bacterium]
METLSFEKAVEEVKDEVVGWRRFLHENPEISFEERETSAFVYETLESFGGLELSRPTETSVVASLVGGSPGKTVALRADIDALPITEENDFEFVSKRPGAMHACGHDGHTAMLLGVAKIMSSMKESISGEVRFIFQHAEELMPGGAEGMIENGVMDGVDSIVGIHLWASLPTGTIGLAYGPMMGSPDIFRITVNGSGGHAAMAYKTVDSIAVGAQVVTNLQHVVSRNISPMENAVLSVTSFEGGTTHNVIPGSVEMEGTVRTLDPEIRKQMPELMERVIKGVTEAHGATHELDYSFGYRPVINDEEVTRVVEETAKNTFGEDAVELQRPTMGGEDFSAYQQKVPGTFIWVGAGSEEKDIVHPHHHPRFTFDEDALPIGVRMHLEAAWSLCSGESGAAR